ncbi:MAG: hypothetical protein AB7O49_03115 [Sphingomonadales bacterium]
MKKTILAAAAILVASSAPSFAQYYYPGNSDGRQYNQERRIHQGVRSGELTRSEARNLRKQQYKIDRYQDRAIADGYLSAREQRKLDRKQDRASERIHRKKHNYRDRW